MTPHRVAAAILAAGLLLAAAPIASAKGPIEARLDAGLSADAAPGTLVRIGFTLGVTEPSGSGAGTWTPVDGWSPFVRLVGSGAETTAPALPDGEGHYTARIRVPGGGISRIEIATRDGSGAERIIRFAAPATAVLDADELDVSLLLPPVSDPHATIDVVVRAAPKAGVALGGRTLPSLVVLARDLRTNLANYAAAERIGPDLYRASLQLPGPGRVRIQAAIGTRAHVTDVLGDPIEIDPGWAPAPAVQGGQDSKAIAPPLAPTAAVGPLGVALLGAGLVALLLAVAVTRHPGRGRAGG